MLKMENELTEDLMVLQLVQPSINWSEKRSCGLGSFSHEHMMVFMAALCE